MNFMDCIRMLGIFIAVLPVCDRPASKSPPVPRTFAQAIHGMSRIRNYTFGTADDRTVGNLQTLARSFDPFGIAGRTVINQEWEVYQPFNSRNFVFTPTSLKLTATIRKGGGLFPGGINSGQIVTKETFKPGYTGHTVYAIEVRMKIPSGRGMWPAAWFYTKQPGQNDGSEIDNPEFWIDSQQNQFDWTGFQHGPGQGAELYSIKTNRWVWHPGLNFAADYHDYQTLWTPDAVYKYLDGTLVYAQSFQWTAPGPAQLIVNLAVGSSLHSLPGLQPNSRSEFPSALSVDHIAIWAK
jgi:beta-glucanase (GH16 family)